MEQQNDRAKLMEEVLFPTVRVRTAKAGGSGTVVYSKPNARNECDTFILTCNHVVEDAVSLVDEWDPLIGRERKKEHRHRVLVEFFKYKYVTRAIGASSVEADIVVWNKKYDVALLKLRSIEPVKYVAKLFPYDRTQEIVLLDSVYIVGCALGHSPILTEGRITSMSDEVDSVSYWMSDAQIIFGNSGGAVFHGARNEFIGVPSLVSVYGWGTPITHMGYFSDIERIYQWLTDECYQFVFRNEYTQDQCAKMREAKRALELDIYKKQAPTVEPSTPEQGL